MKMYIAIYTLNDGTLCLALLMDAPRALKRLDFDVYIFIICYNDNHLDTYEISLSHNPMNLHINKK